MWTGRLLLRRAGRGPCGRHGGFVRDEIISSFLDHAFLDPEDDRVLDEYLDHEAVPGTGMTLRTLLENLGVDREAFREQLRQAQPPLPDYESIPVSPQRRRQQARRRLAERSRSVAARILKDLGVGRNGRELSRAAGRGHQPNLQAAISVVNRRVNEYIGIDAGMRSEISADQAVDAYDQLDHLGDELVATYRPAINGTS